MTATTNDESAKKLTEVSLEFSALVNRRRSLIVLLASFYAIMSIYSDRLPVGPNHAERDQRAARDVDDPAAADPAAADPARRSQSAALQALPFRKPMTGYLFALGVLSLVMTIRFCRLHYGMVIQGVQFAKLSPHEKVEHAITLNFFGVSTQHFVICMVSTVLCAMGIAFFVTENPIWPILTLIVSVLLLVGYFRRCHRTASSKAQVYCQSLTQCESAEDELREHAIRTLDDAHQDKIAIITFLGLMCFSLVQSNASLHLMDEEAARFGEFFFSIMVVIVTAASTIAFWRLCNAVTKFSRYMDASDPGERVLWKLTDSRLGYVIVVLFAVLSSNVLLASLLVDALELEIMDVRPYLYISTIVTAMLMILGYWYFVIRTPNSE